MEQKIFKKTSQKKRILVTFIILPIVFGALVFISKMRNVKDKLTGKTDQKKLLSQNNANQEDNENSSLFISCGGFY